MEERGGGSHLICCTLAVTVKDHTSRIIVDAASLIMEASEEEKEWTKLVRSSD